MHFTSTTPFHMRYTLLNTDTEAIKLTVWYSRPNRLDVYVGGNYVIAKNARINHLGFYVIDMPIGNFKPFLAFMENFDYLDRTNFFVYLPIPNILRKKNKTEIL